jgi:uncharacterized membrane protein YkvA (DUF1232 family)
MSNYEKNYSEDGFWDKLKRFAKKAGSKVVYAALLLYFTLQKPDVPTWAKTVIIGALGYFILPVDIIPDIIVPVGFTDDLGALVAAIGLVSAQIDDEVKRNARKKLREWFGDSDDDMDDLDVMLKK